MGKKQAQSPVSQSNGATHVTSDEKHHVTCARPARETQCGLGSWRPPGLQRCNNMMAFTTTLSFWSLFGSINFSYYTSVITQIEKAYGLSSSMTGFIKNIDNIGYVCFVIVFSHFCRYANKPRLFALATVFSSTAIFIFALPHFIWGTGSRDEATYLNVTLANQSSPGSRVELCDGVHEEESKVFCSNLNTLRSFNGGAMALFIVSEILQGMAQSPKFTLSMTYMDDNAKDKSPFFFAFMFSMRAFAPVIGFMLGAWTTSLYVDLSGDITQKDPRWVGAWWLGFIICAACALVWAAPMLLFPPVIPVKGAAGEDRGEEGGEGTENLQAMDEQQSVLEKARDLPKAVVRLAKNKLYVVVILAICVEIYIIGFMTFLPKYMESYYGLTASRASMITGVQGALAWSLGPLVSGKIVTSLKKVTPVALMRIIVVMTVVSTGLFTATLFLSCPQDKWGGTISPDGPVASSCATNCSCDSQTFSPVCGSDGVNYFTPCQAGCTVETFNNVTREKVYSDCVCIDDGFSTAVPGMCDKQCNTVYIYAVVLFLSKFVASMDIVPTMTVFMRCVEKKDKAIALAVVSAILQVVAFPAPMVFGAIIDSACVVQQGGGSCGGRQGACLHYDAEKLKYYMHGFVVIIKVVGILFYIVGLFISRTSVIYDDDHHDNKDVDTDTKSADTDVITDTDKRESEVRLLRVGYFPDSEDSEDDVRFNEEIS